MTLTPDEIARGEALLNKPLHAAYAWLYKNGRALIAAAKERDELRRDLDSFRRTHLRVLDALGCGNAFVGDEALCGGIRSILAERASLRSERDELRAEVERLRSGLTSAEQAPEGKRKGDGDGC